MDRRRDGDHSPLNEPTQNDLGDGPAVLCGNRGQDNVVEQVVLALDLLAKRMRLHLVHGGSHLVMKDKVHESVGREVGETDGPHCRLG
jgi:hypothetical protein